MYDYGLEGMGFLGIIIGFVALIWGILMLFAPFFWYGAWYRAKQMDLKLTETNQLLSRIANTKV